MIAAAAMIDTSARGGVQSGFPLKLQRILDKFEADCHMTDVVSWRSHGRAFLVKNSARFVREVMPRYFTMSKFSSFQRQLHMYSFSRITASGRDKGAYWHPMFVRGAPEMAVKMQRTRIRGTGTRKPGNPNLEPDFYSMPALPTIAPGTHIDIPNETPGMVPRPGFEKAGFALESKSNDDASRSSDEEEDSSTDETEDELTEQE
jgi:hypothetical protein